MRRSITAIFAADLMALPAEEYQATCELLRQSVARASRELSALPFHMEAWMPEGIAIRKLRHDPRLLAAIQGIHMIELDVDEWRWADLTALGFTPHEVPTFNKVDPTGRVLGEPLRSDGWGGDVPALLPPRLAAFAAASP